MIAEKPTYRMGRDGTLSIPNELLDKIGISEGDYVELTETQDGILISARKSTWMESIEELGRLLNEEGITLDDLIESGREIRGEIYREKYAPLLKK